MANKEKITDKKITTSPLDSLLQLNLKLIKNMSQIEITDFVNKPEKVLENQVRIAIKNSVLFLDYMKQSWEIFSRMVPESPPSLLSLFQGTNFLETISAAAATVPDVAVGNITKQLFSPSLDMDPIDIAKSTAQLRLKSPTPAKLATKKSPGTPKKSKISKKKSVGSK